jgi:hypothetical protein
MASNTTPTYLRGFLVPLSIDIDNIWSAQSSYTLFDSFAGDPSAQQESAMRLYSTGPQVSTSDITIKTQHAGFAGDRAGFIIEDNTGAKDYGYDPQNVITEWMNVKFSSSATTLYLNPDLLDAEDGDLLIAHETKTSIAYGVNVIKQTQDGSQTSAAIYSQGSIAGVNYHPALCKLPDGTYLLAFAVDQGSGAANIRTYSSEDGENWTLRSSSTLLDGIQTGTSTGSGASFQNHDIQRIRMASSNGVVLLCVETVWNDTSATKRNRLIQYASADQGGTFSLITSDNVIDLFSFKSINLYPKDGGFSLVYIGALNEVHYMRIPSGYEMIQNLRTAVSYRVISNDTVATGSNDYMTAGELAAWSDYGISDNVIYSLLSGSFPGSFEIMISTDGFEWRTAGRNINGIGFVLRTGDANTTIKGITASSYTGRTVLIGMADTTATNNSIPMFFLGGYASGINLPLSGIDDDITFWNRMGFYYNLPAIDLFSNYTLTTKFGGGSESLVTDGVSLSNSIYFDFTLSLSGMNTADIIGLGLIVRARIESMTGGSTTGTERRGIRLTIDDTNEDYDVEIRLTSTTIYIHDYNAGSSPGSLGSLSIGSGVDIMIALSNDKLNVWYRTTSTRSNRRDWISALAITGLSDGGGGASNLQKIRFGHTNYSSGSLDTTFNEINVANGFNYSDQLHNFSSPADLSDRPYSPAGKYVWTIDNVMISSVEGATYEGDEFRILPESSHDVKNIFHSISPTPRITWRSEAVTSGNTPEQFIAIKLDPDTSVHVDESLPNDLIGLHLSNINFRSAKLEYYSSGSWTVLDTFSTWLRSTATAQGRTLRGESGLDEFYFSLNECAGWRAYIYNGSAFEWRTVLSNSEGVFGGTSTTTKQAVLLLDESITASSQTVYLVPNNMTLIVNLNGQRVEALGLRITAQETLEKYIQIGTMVLGSVVIPGKQYQRGRSISITSGTESTITQDGIRYARNLRPSQRRIRLGWTEGIDISDLQGDAPDPDYWMSSSSAGAEPVAIENDVPDLLMGLLDYLSGSKDPIVYLPLLSQSSDYRELKREKEQILCTLEGDVEIEHVLGDEFQTSGGEVFRVATISLLEIV